MWWVTLAGCGWFDQTPPTIAIEGPTGTIREAALAIDAVDAAPGVAELQVSIDDGPPLPLELTPGTIRWPIPPMADGDHHFVFTAKDASMFHNVGTADYRIAIDRTPPKIELGPKTAVAWTGKTFAVWLRADEPLVEPKLSLTVMGKKAADPQVVAEVPLYEVDGAWRGLRGIEIEETVGPHALVVEGEDAVGNLARVETTFDVEPSKFEVGGFIKLNGAQTEARKDQEAIDKMHVERDTAYAFAQPQQRWSGAFSKPVPTADLTSPFGKYRSYSDGKKSYHTGLDLSAPRGTPVKSAAPGVVLVAHEQAIFGNVVIVHHGDGVATAYNHLDEIDVKEGDQVDADTVVGLLGATGQATGPHLHWVVEVGVVAVDPFEWLASGFDKSPWPVDSP